MSSRTCPSLLGCSLGALLRSLWDLALPQARPVGSAPCPQAQPSPGAPSPELRLLPELSGQLWLPATGWVLSKGAAGEAGGADGMESLLAPVIFQELFWDAILCGSPC